MPRMSPISASLLPSAWGTAAAPTQYISVWAWGTVARQLVSDGVGKGSVLWVSGSLELEEYTKKDGVTHDKRLKLKLKDWGFPPASQEPRHDQPKNAPLPEIVDGEREALPE